MKHLHRSSLNRFHFAMAVLAMATLASTTYGASPEAPANIVITDNVVAPAPQPFGLNQLNSSWGTNTLNINKNRGGFEKMQIRERWFIDSVGLTPDNRSFFEDSQFYATNYGDGIWDDGAIRIYRPVEGPNGKIYQQIAESQVQKSMIGRGFWPISFGFRSGFSYSLVDSSGQSYNAHFRDVIISGENFHTDGRIGEWYQPTDLENDRTYYYVVRAIDTAGKQSADSVPVTAIPRASERDGPRIITHQIGRVNEGATRFENWIEATNGRTPLNFEVISGLPAGFEAIQGSYGRRDALKIRLINGVTADATHCASHNLLIRVTDADNISSQRTVILNPALSGLDGDDDTAPEPPTNVQALALDGAVHITWDPSPSSDVVGYQVLRSKWAPADQLGRIELTGQVDIQPNDLVFLEKSFSYPLRGDPSLRHDRMIHSAFESDPIEPQWNKNDGSGWQSWNNSYNIGYDTGLEVSYKPHPGTIPPDFYHPGEQAACISTPAGWDFSALLFKTSSIQQDDYFYRLFEPGKTYHLKLWVYQENIPDNQVEVTVSSHTEHAAFDRSFEIPEGEWTLIHIDDWMASDWDQNAAVEYIRVNVKGGGTLYFDHAEIYEFVDENNDGINDEPAREMTSFWKNELIDFFQTQDGSRPTLRYWGLQSNSEYGVSLDSKLKPTLELAISGSSDHLSLPYFLELCLEVGADPWIIASVTLSEEEYANLFEYLAGGSGSTYGDMRIQHRGGITTPWIDEFDHIHIEADNETWNGLFAWTFDEADIDGDGNGDAAKAYGMFAEMLFRAIVDSPLWQSSPGEFDNKVTFVANGFNANFEYGNQVALASPTTEMVDVAPYLGGWESGSYIGGDTLTTEGFSKWLLYSPWKHYGQVNQHTQLARDAATTRGESYILGVYEGGPGYDLPSPTNPSGIVPESYGKSLAAAITTLDSYLFESYRGYGDQAFFGFAPGTRWTTHSQGIEGNSMKFRPQATWLAQKLRNNFISGAMVETFFESVPTIDLPAESRVSAKPDTPLLASYAFKDNDSYYVLLMSRKMPEIGADDTIIDHKVTPVSLQLPITAAQSISLHKIESDPRRTNVPWLKYFDSDDPLKIESQTIPGNALSSNGRFQVTESTGGTTSPDGLSTGIRGGSIYLYVFDGVTAAARPANPTPVIRRDIGQANTVFGRDARFRITFDRPMIGLEAADLDLSESTVDLSSATISLTQIDPMLESTQIFLVNISGASGGGTIKLNLPAGVATAADNGAPNLEANGGDSIVTLISDVQVLHFNSLDLEDGSNYLSSRTKEYDVLEEDNWYTFDFSTPLFPYTEAPRVYGGIRAAMDGDLANPEGIYVLSRIMASNRDSDDPYPSTNCIGFDVNGNGGRLTHAWSLMLFKKDDFSGIDPQEPLALNAGSSLKLNTEKLNGSARRIHFILKDNSNYYISEATQEVEGEFSLYDFHGNPHQRWAIIPFSEGTKDFSTHLDNYESLNYTAHAFTHVEAAGFASYSRGNYFRAARFTDFTLTVVTDLQPHIEFDLDANPQYVVGNSTKLSLSAIDSDSSILSFNWETVSAPSGANPIFTSGELTTGEPGETIENLVLVDRSGDYVFRVAVSDGSTTTTSKELTVTVNGDFPKDEQYGGNLLLNPSFSSELVSAGGWLLSEQNSNLGWIYEGSNSLWARDGATDVLQAVGWNGAKVVAQVIEEDSKTTGSAQLSFKARNQGQGNALSVHVYGLNEPFKLLLWNPQSPVERDGNAPIGDLLFEKNYGGEEYEWSDFEEEFPFGNSGYQYILIYFQTGGVNPINGDGQAIDAVKLLKLPSQYEIWSSAFAWPNPGIDDLPTADPNCDGIVNEIAYATDIHPLGNGTLPTLLWVETVDKDEAQTITLRFRRATGGAEGLTYSVLASPNLVDWTPIDFALPGNSITPLGDDPDGDGSAETVEVIINKNGERSEFLRLDVRSE